MTETTIENLTGKSITARGKKKFKDLKCDFKNQLKNIFKAKTKMIYILYQISKLYLYKFEGFSTFKGLYENWEVEKLCGWKLSTVQQYFINEKFIEKNNYSAEIRKIPHQKLSIIRASGIIKENKILEESKLTAEELINKYRKEKQETENIKYPSVKKSEQKQMVVTNSKVRVNLILNIPKEFMNDFKENLNELVKEYDIDLI